MCSSWILCIIQKVFKSPNLKIFFVLGYGIPYKPSEIPLDTYSLGESVQTLYHDMLSKDYFQPFKLSLECGRFITGPAGILVTRVINKKCTYKNYLGNLSFRIIISKSLMRLIFYISIIHNWMKAWTPALLTWLGQLCTMRIIILLIWKKRKPSLYLVWLIMKIWRLVRLMM